MTVITAKTVREVAVENPRPRGFLSGLASTTVAAAITVWNKRASALEFRSMRS